MKKRIQNAMAIIVLTALGASAAVVEQWTFEGATPNIGTNGMDQDQWTTTAPNSVPSAGVLRYATDGNGNSEPMAGGAIDPSTIDAVVLTIDLTDMNIGNQVVFQFGQTGGAGNMEVEFNTFANNQFTLDVEGGGTTLSPAAILDQDDFAGAIPLSVEVTWDFANNLMSYDVTGSATDSQSIAADLSGITSINNFRPRGGTMQADGTYLDLDTITIETVIPEPATLGLVAAFGGGILFIRRRFLI